MRDVPRGRCGFREDYENVQRDVVDELAGGKHAAAGIGCIRCHGPSKAHLADENNEVKPDRMPKRDRIDSFCASCHKCSRPVKPVPPAATRPKPKTCTDCHGTHKIKRQGGMATRCLGRHDGPMQHARTRLPIYRDVARLVFHRGASR